MASETTQPSLLSRVRDPSDEAAWRQFEAKYRDLILRYCRRKGLQLSDAEDVLQVVLLSLAKALPKFSYSPQRGRFRSYLGTVVRNVISHHMSRPNGLSQALDISVVSQLADPEASALVDGIWEREWALHHFRQAMRSVRQTFEERSMAAFDRLLAGDSVAQVADAFGMSPEGVHKIKQRVRDRLKDVVARQIQAEELTHEPV